MNDAFARWLSSATGDLPPAQGERARAELTNHYRDAVDAYCAQGHPSDLAAHLALADLGDPGTTAHAFAATGRAPWRLVRRYVRRFIGSTAGRFTLALVAFSLPLASFLIGADLHATVVLLQTALLALILCIPLYFDDLDLSVGVVALMGTLVAQSPYSVIVHQRGVAMTGTHLVMPASIGSAIIIAMLAGGLIGCVNGLLAGVLRRPVAQITAFTAIALALLLQPFHARHQSIWSVYPPGMEEVIGAPAVRYLHERDTITGATVALFAAVLLLVVTAARLASDRGRQVAPPRTRPAAGASWTRRRKRVAAGLGLLPFVLYLARLNHAFLFDPFVVVLAVLVCTALVVIGDGLLHTRGDVWFIRREAERAESTNGARVLRLALCSALAAVTGALITAHGMRDNTYEYAASFLIIVPLASLLVGGQHVLRGPYRLVGGVAGILFVAALTSWPDDYKLNDDSVFAVLLAAVSVAVWRWVLRPQLLAAAPVDHETARGEQPGHHLDVNLVEG